MKSRGLNDELKKMGEADLRERAKSISEELMKLRFRKTIGQLEHGHRFGQLRRDRARVMTQLRMIRSKGEKGK